MNKITRLLTILAAAGSLYATALSANPLLYHDGYPGFIVLPEQRFDPAMQRYMAERSLRALPLQNGQLYYVYPVTTSTAYVEQMQIRYIEALLASEAKAEAARAADVESVEETAVADEPNAE